MKKIFSFALLLLPMIASAEKQQLTSPDGRIVVSVDLNDKGQPVYAVDYDGTPVVLPSLLGVETNVADLTQGLSLAGKDERKVNDCYMLSTIKQSHVNYEANELVCHYAKEGKRLLDIEFRASNSDVAFRYRLLPKGETSVCVVKREVSTFGLSQATTTFLCPQAKPMTGFARTAPSYETNYTLDDTAGKNGWGMGYTFPCLFKTNNLWLMISETGVDGNYCASRLLGASAQNGSCYSFAFPMPEECNGWGTVEPAMALPSATPWRTLTVGTTLKNIVETTVAFDLVAPKYKPSVNYTYGKGTWSWIIGMDSSCNFDEQKRYVDFSAALGYRSVLVDALWDTQIGYQRIEELSSYAKSKGVGLFLWYNSNGRWNDAPQGPRHKMDRVGARRQEMAWMQRAGILGIKVDFFGGDKQHMMQLYEDILTDANDFGLQVIFHGCTLPRGWERMYPNFVASEAVLASENLHFSQGMCDNEAKNGCTHTFIRNTVGSMDFGGSTLNKYYHASNSRGSKRITSDVYALATAVLFQSSVQHFALAPNNLTDAPAWAINFMKEVPTTWNEVKYLDGYPGKYAILARSHGDKWYVAGINAQEETVERLLTLPGVSGQQTVTLYSDNGQLVGSEKQVKTDKKGRIKVSIPKNGGVVVKY